MRDAFRRRDFALIGDASDRSDLQRGDLRGSADIDGVRRFGIAVDRAAVGRDIDIALRIDRWSGGLG